MGANAFQITHSIVLFSCRPKRPAVGEAEAVRGGDGWRVRARATEGSPGWAVQGGALLQYLGWAAPQWWGCTGASHRGRGANASQSRPRPAHGRCAVLTSQKGAQALLASRKNKVQKQGERAQRPSCGPQSIGVHLTHTAPLVCICNSAR